MNIQRIFTDLADADPDVYERISPRRASIRTFLRGISMAAVPVALGGLLQKAYGQSTPNTALIIDTLNFALTAEYLESNFYTTGMNTPGLVAQFNTLGIRDGVELLRQNETAHRELVKATIIKLGGTPKSEPRFDFTGGKGQGGGPFQDVLTNAATFIAVAQAFEETGVRAYKGQAKNLMTDKAVLTAALDIHSVEGRHAAYLRMVRKTKFNVDIKPWITGTESGIPQPAAQPSYAGEDNTMQSTVNIITLPNSATKANITTAAATEAFDEPLDRATVEAILSNFIIP
ncbi:MAG: ferritin-like domain-containing protein [Sphingobacteriales bacterium]|nr:MAG: ferritin-like domain-containing protein [Sphingobacteriales bacterium]